MEMTTSTTGWTVRSPGQNQTATTKPIADKARAVRLATEMNTSDDVPGSDWSIFPAEA